MSNTEPEYSYWDFARTVYNERRWIFDGQAMNYLSAVRASSKSHSHTLKSGRRLFRTQSGSDSADDERGVEWEHPLQEDRMVPNPKFLKNGGRANPPGFAYLYVATDKETALAEMRPWIGESITLAIFELQRDVNLVVCRPELENTPGLIAKETASADTLSKYDWDHISRAFSRPVSRGDQENAYVPTQILAEAFKAEGFDGVAYKSGLERGLNVVLFDIRAAKIMPHRFVYTLKKVRYDFEAAPNYAIYSRTSDGDRYLYEIHCESP